MAEDKKIKIVTISGSVRPGNNTQKALDIVNDELQKIENVELVTINPADYNLSLPGLSDEGTDAAKLSEIVGDAVGLVIATPEYHGSYSSTVKLVIDNLGFPSSLAGKPVALLGVAAGQIGAIKAMEHLRSVLSHVGAIVLPGPVSVANVFSILNEDGSIKDEDMEKVIRGVATKLLDYIKGSICPRIALEEMVRNQ